MLEQSIVNTEKSSVNDPILKPDELGFKITGHNLVLQPVEVEEVTKSGIILTAQTIDDVKYLNNVCRVVQKGSLAYTQDAFKGEVWCEVGDYVLIPKNSGQKFLLGGIPAIIISCDKVLATIDDPAVVDPRYNLGV